MPIDIGIATKRTDGSVAHRRQELSYSSIKFMTTVLALDAAWTAAQPSGVALVQTGSTGWHCIGLAPSYAEFFAQAEGKATVWSSRVFVGTQPDVPRMLDAATSLAGESVDIVTLDMPVATLPFSSRRVADDIISAKFGSRWCSTHTPSATRPGPLSARLSSAFHDNGYELTTTSMPSAKPKRLIEVYPHLALLSLLRLDRRLPYKVGKSTKYWPHLSIRDRIITLLNQFNSIYAAIENVFGSLGFALPLPEDVPSLAYLKRYEDALDALVCAWVGVEYFNPELSLLAMKKGPFGARATS
jgi:predicted RNase H-like nuclease